MVGQGWLNFLFSMDFLWRTPVTSSPILSRNLFSQLVLLFFQEVWVVSASVPQLPLQIEDAMRNEESETTDADGGIRVRVNQVRSPSSIAALSL